MQLRRGHWAEGTARGNPPALPKSPMIRLRVMGRYAVASEKPPPLPREDADPGSLRSGVADDELAGCRREIGG